MKYLWLFICLAASRGRASLEENEDSYLCVPEESFKCPTPTNSSASPTERCLNRRSICDGHKDCSDNWDEANCKCTRNKQCPKGIKCERDYQAATSACNCGKLKHFVKSQCEDIDECKNPDDVCAGKGSSCVNHAFEPQGYECPNCPEGYEASLRDSRLFISNPAYNKSENFRTLLLCTDHNECGEKNSCRDRHCFNRIGNYSCECPPNHEKRSDIRENVCQAIGEQPLMAIGGESSILVFDLRSAMKIQELRWHEPIVDLSADNGMVIFATRRRVVEYRIATENTLILADFENDDEFSNSDIKQISTDWENHRVYVLTGDSVVVVDVVGRAVKIIEHRGNISSIAVDPVAGFLFYSQYEHVHRSTLDGSGESKLIFSALPSEDRGNIEVLAVDPNLESVYYISNRVLYSFDYEGHRPMIISGSAHYSRLEPFEDLLYATYQDSDSDSIVTLGRTGYSIGDPPEPRLESFKGSLPKSFAIIQRAKFPTRPKELNSCLSMPCSSKWCFPMPLSRTSSLVSTPTPSPSLPSQPLYRCDCGVEKRGNCLSLKTYQLRPDDNDIPNEEKISIAGASVPITAHTSTVGIIIPIVLAVLNSLAYFR